MSLSAQFRATLTANRGHQFVIDFPDHPDRRITDETFANFLVKLQKVETPILDQVGDASLKADRGQRGVLTKTWREADAFENLRLERKDKGVGAEDLEDPLPEGEHCTDVPTFHHFNGAVRCSANPFTVDSSVNPKEQAFTQSSHLHVSAPQPKSSQPGHGSRH